MEMWYKYAWWASFFHPSPLKSAGCLGQKWPSWTRGAEGAPQREGNAPPWGVNWPPSLLKSLSKMTPASSLGLTLRVRSWSLFGLGRDSLTVGGEPSTTAYGSGLALQLLWFLYHCEDGSSPNPGGMGGKNWGLALAVDREFSAPFERTLGTPTPGRGGQLTPLIRGGGVRTKALE